MRRSDKVTLDLDPDGDPIGGWVSGRNVAPRRFDGYVQLIGVLEGRHSRSRHSFQTREDQMVKSVRMMWAGGLAVCVAVAALAIVALSGGGSAHGRTAQVRKTAQPITPEEWQQLTNSNSYATPTVVVTPTGNVTCATASSSKLDITLMQFRTGSGAVDGNLGDPGGRWTPISYTTSPGIAVSPVTLPAASGGGTGYDQVQTSGTDCSGQSTTETTPPLQVGNGSVSGVSVPSAPQNPNLSMYRIQGQSNVTSRVSWSPPASMASCSGGPASDYIVTLESSPDGTSSWVPVYEQNYASSNEQLSVGSYMLQHGQYVRVLVSLATPCGQAGPAATSNVINASQYL
jgi:hypothetical protein